MLSVRTYFKRGSSIDGTMDSWSQQIAQLGLVILRLDSVIPKEIIVLNVDLDGLDPIISKGRIVEDVDVGIDHP